MSDVRTWKDWVRSAFPWPLYWWLKRRREEFLAWFVYDDLTALAKVYKSDKWGHHFYTPVYQSLFDPLRTKPVRLLEIGVGGYANPRHGGDSIRMWKRFFPKGHITTIDIYDKQVVNERRIHFLQGNQTDPEFLQKVSASTGPFDIIIDDGSHVQSHIIKSYETLFPLMKPGGIYIIEDTQTAYWPKYEGSSTHMLDIPSCMNYFIKRIHGVNRAEWRMNETLPDIPDEGIASIAFYHNLIVIVKK